MVRAPRDTCADLLSAQERNRSAKRHTSATLRRSLQVCLIVAQAANMGAALKFVMALRVLLLVLLLSLLASTSAVARCFKMLTHISGGRSIADVEICGER
jgi:hypothetical protein